jgi:hypothetical protein
LFLPLLAYVLYRYPMGTSGVSPLFYGVPVLGAAVCMGLPKSPDVVRVNVALVLISTAFAVCSAELFLTLRPAGQAVSGATGSSIDKSTKFDGPLLEFAAVREYLPAVRPAVVLWMYFERNDLPDLAKEAENPRSSTHLRAARGIST